MPPRSPAVVTSPEKYAQRYGDLAVIGLTSQVQPEPFLSLKDWHAAGLLGPSWIKPTIFTLSESIIDRQIGALSAEDARCIPQALVLLVTDPCLP